MTQDLATRKQAAAAIVAELEQKRANAASARAAMTRLAAVGVDMADVEDALSEYTDIMREDYEDRDEYADERASAWESLLDSIREAVEYTEDEADGAESETETETETESETEADPKNCGYVPAQEAQKMIDTSAIIEAVNKAAQPDDKLQAKLEKAKEKMDRLREAYEAAREEYRAIEREVNMNAGNALKAVSKLREAMRALGVDPDSLGLPEPEQVQRARAHGMKTAKLQYYVDGVLQHEVLSKILQQCSNKRKGNACAGSISGGRLTLGDLQDQYLRGQSISDGFDVTLANGVHLQAVKIDA